ncbi:hypothetical protein ACIPZF_21875 [Pseudomonas sp. NPDC089752]|uniref:hypothetical protein n=1 Tax=Pseudomonas sp. NPDC089752 TaxID=3364472 RepID=UPI0037F14648
MIKLIKRLRDCLKAKPSKAVPVEPAFAPTRVEQNLAWLPRNRVLEPLDLPLPLALIGAPLQHRYCAFMAQIASSSAPLDDDMLREAGRRLAAELLTQAITLGGSKAHEQSDEVYWLVQSAAVASLFADGAQSAEFARYRQHVQSYESASRMATQVKAFERYVAADGQPVEDEEMLSTSADDHYRILVKPWEAANTHWIYSPRIVDTRAGTCLLRFKDARWSSDISTWHTLTTVELVLRKYPGGKEARVLIDCANRCARLEKGGELELTQLECALDAYRESD